MSDYKGVEDTLFIPLTARISVSKKFPEYFYDKKALEMEDLIKANTIEKKSSEYAMIANVARSYNMDQITQDFIDSHGKCNIVNLGVGLETSYHRLDRKDSIFYEIDLPEVINLREKILGIEEKEKLIKGDMFKLEWCDEIDKSLPTFLVVSGVFQYFHEEEILEFIGATKEIFENAELIFDATNKFGIRYTNFYVKRTGNKSAQMYFYIEDPEEFAGKSNCKLIEWRCFYKDAIRILDGKVGFYTKIAMKIAENRRNAMILHLKL